MELTITGLQEAQQANLKLMAALKPGGALEEAVRVGTIAAHRYAVAQTHVDTGALKASHRTKIESRADPMGMVFIDPSARNPRSRTLTAQYGAAEEARGGEHAFYEITVTRHGNDIAQQAIAAFISRLPH
jgi:hypothetical protein